MEAHTRGDFQAVGYTVTFSLSALWLHHLGDKIDPFILLFGTTMCAWGFFTLLRIRRFRTNHKTIFKNPLLYLATTTVLAFLWVASYFSLILMSPTLGLILVFLIEGVIAASVKRHWAAVLTTIFTIILIATVTADHAITFLGAVCALAAGSLAYIYSKLSHRLAHLNNLSGLDVLMIRYYVLMIVSFLGAWFYYDMDPNRQTMISETLILTIMLFALCNNILPGLCSQTAIVNIGAERFTFISAFAPVITFAGECWLKQSWDWGILSSILLTAIALNSHGLFERLSHIKRIKRHP